MAKENTREKIIAIAREAGYDVISSCEMADKCLQEFRRDKAKKRTFTVGNKSFTLLKK